MIAAIVTNLLLVLGLSMLALVVARFIKRPSVLHGIWLLVLLRLFVPPLLEVDCLPGDWLGSPIVTDSLAESSSVVSPLEAVGSPVSRGEEPSAFASFRWRSSMDWALLVWIAGSLGGFLITGYRFHRFQRVLDLAVVARPELQERTLALAQRLGMDRAPEVRLISGRFPPMVWTWLGCQVLILPNDLFSRLEPEELDPLLVHELAHVRRRDHLVRILELLAQVIFWWYPVVW